MAIEGPLRELSIHDVFQMLDLSRKTGALRVTSELRDNEGTVVFDHGRVVSASIRSSPAPLGIMLVRAGRITRGRSCGRPGSCRPRGRAAAWGDSARIGAISARELERQVRLQVEAVVFELMSWHEGFFSFEERDVSTTPLDATVFVSTESLLMEGARRIDEWSRIVDKVPHLGVVPVLATTDDDHATRLDLLPSEWEVLAAIDGASDLRSIAARLGRSEFDVARVIYGLCATGVVELRDPGRAHTNGIGPAVDVEAELATAWAAVHAGRAEDALSAARLVISAEPRNAEARLAAARALRQLKRFGDASEELRRAAQVDPGLPAIHLELGYTAACRGDFGAAVASWEHFLRATPNAPEASGVREAVASATQLRHFVEAYASVQMTFVVGAMRSPLIRPVVVFLPLGEALRRSGQLDLALKVATRGLERHPYDADAHDLLARVWSDRGDVERARDEWEAALRCSTDHVGALKGIGFLCFGSGRVARSRAISGARCSRRSGR